VYEQNKTDLAYLSSHFDYNKLSGQKKISYDFYKQRLESAIEAHAYRFHNYAIEQHGGQSADLFLFMHNNHKVDSLEDAQYFLERVSGLGGVFYLY